MMTECFFRDREAAAEFCKIMSSARLREAGRKERLI
jgi:hypothetical protein